MAINSKVQKFMSLLFGMLSVSIIYSLIIQRMMLFSFKNNLTGQLQYQQDADCLLLGQQFMVLIFTEFFTEIRLKKQQQNCQTKIMPYKNSFFLSILKVISLILFVKGLYATSFRFAFAVRSCAYLVSTIIGLLYSRLINNLQNKPKLPDLIYGAMIVGGLVLFWVFDPEINYYVPIPPQVIGTVMIIISTAIESGFFLAISKYNQRYQNINHLRSFRDIIAWTGFLIIIYSLITAKFHYSLQFPLKHLQYLLQTIGLGFFTFIEQMILFKTTEKLPTNISGYFISTSMALIVLISYAFSVHFYNIYQMFGMGLAWFGAVLALLHWIKIANKKDYRKQIPQNSIQNLTLQNEL